MLLNTTQQRTLQAAMDRILPPDDWPGAWEAGAGDYLLRQLTGDLHHLLPTYQQGLDALEAESQAQFQTGFADLETARQDALLANIEKGTVQTHWTAPPHEFFSLLVNHTAEGFYSDPGNGGNRNGVAWKMIGFTERLAG